MKINKTRWGKTKGIAEIIASISKSSGWETYQKEIQLIDCWKTIAPEYISSSTINLFYEKLIFFVAVKESAIKFKANLEKRQLLDKLETEITRRQLTIKLKDLRIV